MVNDFVELRLCSVSGGLTKSDCLRFELANGLDFELARYNCLQVFNEAVPDPVGGAMCGDFEDNVLGNIFMGNIWLGNDISEI